MLNGSYTVSKPTFDVWSYAAIMFLSEDLRATRVKIQIWFSLVYYCLFISCCVSGIN